MRTLEQCRLYAFVDAAYLNGRDPADIARQLCDGGADLIQLRAKQTPLDQIRRMAETILPVIRQAGAGLVINDHLDLAREVGADFCHLGQEDFLDTSVERVGELRVAGSGPRIGLSTHAPDQATRAMASGADYIAIGPVYATPTKPTARAVTLDYVRWAARNVTIPWFAIGGINLLNLDEVLAAGARRICVVSALLNAANVTAACHEFRKRLI